MEIRHHGLVLVFEVVAVDQVSAGIGVERTASWIVSSGLRATDSRLPDDSSNHKVAALLLLDSIDAVVTTEQLRVTAAEILVRFPLWAKRYHGDNGAEALVADALEVLRGFNLVRCEDDGLVHPLPAAARYAVVGTRTTEHESVEDAQ